MKGNQARRLHDLRATSARVRRARSNRARRRGRWLAEQLAAEGRPLKAYQRSYAQDFAAAWIFAEEAQDELEARKFPRQLKGNEKLKEAWESMVNLKIKLGDKLKITTATEERALEREEAADATEQLRQKYALVRSGIRRQERESDAMS